MNRSVLLALLFLPTTSEAARYAALFDETVDGKENAPLAVEAALSEALIKRGATLIDEAQSRRIRSVTSAGELIAGRIHEVVTTLDADVLIAGIARTERAAAPALVKQRVAAFETHVTVKLIAVDSGEIVGTITLSQSAFGTSDSRAVADATRRAAEQLAGRIVEAESARLGVELSVEALPTITAARELAGTLSALPEVETAAVVHASTEITEYRLALSEGADVGALVGALDDSPLVVTAYTGRTLRARYAAGRSIPSAQLRQRSPLQITTIEVDEIFPARTADHRARGAGVVEIENSAARRITGALLRVRIAGFTREIVEVKLPPIAPKSLLRVPLQVALDPDAISRHKNARPATLTVELVQADRSLVRRTAQVNVLDRSAVDWKVKDSVAAFVTHRDEVVRAAAQQALAAIPPSRRTDPLARAAALFEVLRGVRYQRDAVYPGRADDLDDVQLPTETLERGAGDCDDLAVLYAALAEAAGIRAALVLTPGHVLAAVDSELPEQAAAGLTVTPERLLTLGGRAWIPIETTHLFGSFADAWQRGATALRSSNADVIVVREAWSQHPPVPWAPQVARAPTPRRIEGGRIEAALASIEVARRAEWTSAVAALDRLPLSTDTLNRRGLLMMAAGRTDEAEVAFERAVERPDATPEVINNLANVHLVRGRHAEAASTYQRALGKGADARIRLNAAIAARITGDHQSFAEQITECLEASGGRALVQQLLSALEGFETARGASSDQVGLRSLAVAIRTLAERRGITFQAAGDRASEERVLAVEQVLFWLR